MIKLYSKKIENDKFYTKHNISKFCIDAIDFNIYDFVIEPSAGAGSFLSQIPHENKLGIDLYPERDDILEMSWFDYIIPDTYAKVLIIGNPPFGIRNRLSKEFILHSIKFSNVYTIAFILPDVFNKHTLQKIIPEEYRIKSILKLPKNSFEIKGLEYNVPCSFFVFEKSDGLDLRFNPLLYQDTPDWEYGTESDYNFYVMGSSIVVKDVPEKNNRGYYIKIKSNKNIDAIKNNFKYLIKLKKLNKLDVYSSVNGGNFWLTKSEMVRLYLKNINTSK